LLQICDHRWIAILACERQRWVTGQQLLQPEYQQRDEKQCRQHQSQPAGEEGCH
jgi:hypothetical protein